jgi:hypothetical protein
VIKYDKGIEVEMDFTKNKTGRSKPVRLDKRLKEALKEFLDTDRARKLGYKQETDVVNAAVRALLERYHFDIDDDQGSNESVKNNA